MIAQHSSETNEHYTPGDIVERARLLMGSIDLDPASCLEANQTVKASRIYTQADDGLAQQWYGNVFLNPPGGVLRQVDGQWIVPEKRNPHLDKSSAAVWWARLVEEWLEGRTLQAFFVGFTLEILRTSQDAKFPVQFFPRCYPKQRIRFRGASPTHANVLVWIPPMSIARDRSAQPGMHQHFQDLGYCE
jgi:hypothetical protein